MGRRFESLDGLRGLAGFVLTPGLFALAMLAWYRRPMAGETGDPVGLAMVLVFTAVCAWLVRPTAEPVLRWLSTPARTPRLAVGGLAALVVVVGLAIAWGVLTGFPNSGDEYAYVLQAETYARGRLWADPPAVAPAFDTARFFTVDGRWVSQYTPGWALLLAPAAAVGLPLWVVGPLVGGLAIAVFHTLARHNLPPRVSWLCTLLFGGSAFFLLNAASYFNHVLTAALGMAAVLFAQAYLRSGRWAPAVLTGLTLGLVGITRTQDAVPFGLAIAVAMLLTRDRRAGLFWMGLGGAPFLAALGAYNMLVTGDVLQSAQTVRGDEPIPGLAPAAPPVEHAMQAVPVAEPAPAVQGAGRWTSVRLTVQRIARLCSWTTPLAVLAWPAAWVELARRRGLEAADWIMPLTGLIYLVYAGDGGNQYGPRYYFAAWPFMLLTVAKAGWGVRGRPGWRPWMAAGLAAALAMQVAYLPARLVREHQVVVERQAVPRAVAAAGLRHALVMIDEPVGRLRVMEPMDLNRNGLDVAGRDVIYARKVPDWPAVLSAAYPGRALYVYENGGLRAVASPAPHP